MTIAPSPWPVDLDQEFLRRAGIVQKLQDHPDLARSYYASDPVKFINDLCFTYDPRLAGTGTPASMPFRLFQRQEELVRYFQQLIESQSSGLVEKCRDMGATWTAVSFAVWLWLFRDGASVGFGSRKELLVDRLGDMDSIFEKVRFTIANLPGPILPRGYVAKKHSSYMKLLNPETSASITGEAGDNIGRGGRKLIYYKDEALPLWELVLTPDGWRSMGDIQAGDQVIGSDGLPTLVTHAEAKGIHPCHKLSFSDGSSAVASENHVWLVNSSDKRGKSLLMRTWELEGRFRRVCPCGKARHPFSVPPVVFRGSRTSLPLHPYVVGALLGDGHFGGAKHEKGRSVVLTSADPFIPRMVNDLLPEGCHVKLENPGRGIQYPILLDHRPSKKGVLRLALEEIGLHGVTGEGKFIPGVYKLATAEDRLELLRGLMDTDGSYTGRSAVFSNKSARLASDLAELVRGLGGAAHCRKDKEGCWRVAVALDQNPFKLPRKASIWNRKFSVGRKLVSVEPAGVHEVKCITVEAEDGIYVTKDHLATHNSAHYDHSELIEAALMDNTNVQVDISSVNGTGNVFHRRRMAGDVWEGKVEDPKKTQVFIMDWRDHPAKTQEWFDARRAKAEEDGLMAEFAQEVERSYSASVLGTVIKAEWVEAAIGLARDFELDVSGKKRAALDVADDGVAGDRNALALVHGLEIMGFEHWGMVDTGVTATKAYSLAIEFGATEIHYDSIGVGSGVKGQFNAMRRDGQLPESFKVVPWVASGKVHDPSGRVDKPAIANGKPVADNGPVNKDFFANFKAQAWWRVRNRFHNAWRCREGLTFDPEEVISINPDLSKDKQRMLVAELSQPVRRENTAGKMIVNKSPNGSRSPNVADAVIMAAFPAKPASAVSSEVLL